MTGINDLPVEILDQIIKEISPELQGTLSNLSLTCRSIYLRVLPTLYQSYRIKLFGRPSWPTRTEIMRRLVPPGSYEIPVKNLEDSESDGIVDRKGKGVAGRPSTSRKVAVKKEIQQPKKLPLREIREVVICGYWNTPKEEHSDEYFLPNDGDVREHTPFIDALEALLWRIDHLESFHWKVTRPMPPQITAAVARFDSLKTVSIFGDTHMYATAPTYRYHHTPAPVTNNPIPFSHNSLVTLKALQTGDYQQVIQYGDVMRTGTNWETIKHLEFDISPGFIGLLVEMEPMEPDILAGLFRPPPPPRGRLSPPKMKLHSLKLRDIAFQHKGIEAIVKSIDASQLRDLDFYYCQEVADLLRKWENNKLKGLERIHIKEELALPYLCKFLKQFGPEGTCRNLKTLELCCWHVDRWNLYDPMHAHGSMYADYDSESDMWDEEDDYPDDLSDDTHLDPSPHTHAPSVGAAPPVPKLKWSLPQPFRSIKELRGKKEEGWGLERLVLDMRPGVSSITTKQLPQQETFFEGFWRVRELAIPVSYDNETCWNQFVDTMAKLPSLEYLFLLNARTEARSGGNYVNFSIYQPPFMMPPRPGITAPPAANIRTNKRKAKSKEQEPDKLYIDALSIAAKNRLLTHGSGPTSVGTSSSAAAAEQTVWHGKLKYIGIRAMYPIGIRQPVRVWRVIVDNASPRKRAPDGSAERRRTLRSSTKRRKVETGDWRMAEDNGATCRLEEITDEKAKKTLGGGIFNGMQRFTEDEV
ncbi:hypothetical protein FN846DRAFT_979278 [Sphaerosporella brunnea]|uniref:F-box domain-containing protein n=1 Tax=Sphaerosporella brunnea TaxID=1250544 RepID=A0A5J5ECV5_9PEZI|nr:hypothetical protein FN846DRAFT_979278 [Sphaerosporella brunnea]